MIDWDQLKRRRNSLPVGTKEYDLLDILLELNTRLSKIEELANDHMTDADDEQGR